MKISDIRSQLVYRDTAPHRAINSIKYIVIHHDAVEAPTEYNPIELYKREANYHYNKDWNGDGKVDGSGLMYHYKIDRWGNIYFCRNLGEALWHCGNYTKNLQSIAICLDGHLTNQKPTKAQLQSLKDFLVGLCTQHPEFPAGFSSVFGHREISATNCPGDNLIKFVQDFRKNKGQVNIENYSYETGEPQEPTVTIEQLQAEVKAKDDTIFELKDRVAELQGIEKDLEGTIEGFKQALEQEKQESANFLNKLAENLNCGLDKTTTLGCIEEIKAQADRVNLAESNLVKANNKIKKLNEELATNQDNCQTRLTTKSEEIDGLKTDLARVQKELAELQVAQEDKKSKVLLRLTFRAYALTLFKRPKSG